MNGNFKNELLFTLARRGKLIFFSIGMALSVSTTPIQDSFSGVVDQHIMDSTIFVYVVCMGFYLVITWYLCL